MQSQFTQKIFGKQIFSSLFFWRTKLFVRIVFVRRHAKKAPLAHSHTVSRIHKSFSKMANPPKRKHTHTSEEWCVSRQTGAWHSHTHEHIKNQFEKWIGNGMKGAERGGWMMCCCYVYCNTRTLTHSHKHNRIAKAKGQDLCMHAKPPHFAYSVHLYTILALHSVLVVSMRVAILADSVAQEHWDRHNISVSHFHVKYIFE